MPMALSSPIRGYPIEAFSFPDGGLPQLLQQPEATFELEATLRIGKDHYRYRVKVRIAPSSGGLSVEDEYLAALTSTGAPKGNPAVEKMGNQQYHEQNHTQRAHLRAHRACPPT